MGPEYLQNVVHYCYYQFYPKGVDKSGVEHALQPNFLVSWVYITFIHFLWYLHE